MSNAFAIVFMSLLAVTALPIGYFLGWTRKPKQAALDPNLPTRFASDWTAEDQGRWNNFLASDSGQSLLNRLRATAWHSFLRAGQNDGPEAMAAFKKSAGYMECVEHLESLSRVSLPRNTEDNIDARRSEGEPELSEAYAP
jgi:hypothetical protein